MRLYDLIREIEARGEGWVLDDGADLWDTDSLLDDLLSDDDGVVALEQEAVWVPIDDAGTGSIVTLNPDGYQGRTLYRVRRLQ